MSRFASDSRGVRFVAKDGRVLIVSGDASMDVTDAMVMSVEQRQEVIDVGTFDNPNATIPGRRTVTIEMDLPPSTLPETAAPDPPEAPEEPQERAERRARLELPPEGERPAGRILGPRGGR